MVQLVREVQAFPDQASWEYEPPEALVEVTSVPEVPFSASKVKLGMVQPPIRLNIPTKRSPRSGEADRLMISSLRGEGWTSPRLDVVVRHQLS